MTMQQMRQLLRAAGVVGAGGAGFPTHGKLAEGIDTVIINAVECEPLLYTDLVLLRHARAELLSGARQFADAMGAKDVVLALKKHNAEHFGWQQGEQLESGATAAVLPDVYPMGDELIMIYEALGRIVPPGSLPSSVGVVVVNAETALNIYNAVNGEPVRDKWLTVGGDIDSPCVIKAPIGMPVAQILRQKGIPLTETHALVDGGPAMGRIIDPATAVVTKTTKGLLVLPKKSAAVANKTADMGRLAKRVPSACCQCRFCTDMCPRALLGYPLQPHKTLRAAAAGQLQDAESLLATSLCSSCGLCTFVACCQGVAPSACMTLVKNELAQNGLRYASKQPTQPDKLRGYRMVPSGRFAAMLGVRRFVKDAPFDAGFTPEVSALVLPLRQHVGKPSVPCVQPGDRVERGAVLAKADEGISAALHAPCDGVVGDVTAECIVLRHKEA